MSNHIDPSERMMMLPLFDATEPPARQEGVGDVDGVEAVEMAGGEEVEPDGASGQGEVEGWAAGARAMQTVARITCERGHLIFRLFNEG